MASIIIGVMGKKRSGKDTFAARLVSEHGYTRLAFADALKESLLELDPIIGFYRHEAPSEYSQPTGFNPRYSRLSKLVHDIGWDAAKQIDEVRSLLQRHGVAMRNHVHADVWVDAVEEKIRRTSGPVVITDVRFPNEADMIEEGFGGTLVRIVRPGQVADDTHISETALDDREAEYVIPNGYTIENLHATADSLAATLSAFADTLSEFSGW